LGLAIGAKLGRERNSCRRAGRSDSSNPCAWCDGREALARRGAVVIDVAIAVVALT
jgi:hypothetical protein